MRRSLNLSRRRALLQIATAAGAGLAMRPTLRLDAAPTEQAPRMSLGLVTYLWGQDWDLPTLIRNCEQTGVLGVELRTEHAHGVEPDLSKAERAAVRKRFEDSPVAVLGPGTNWAFHDPDPAVLKQQIAGAQAHIVLSHDIGGTGVKVKPNALPKDVPVQKTIEQIGTSLNQLARFAENYGQQIRVEVHGRETQELPIMARIMEVADHPQVTVCWNSNDADLHGEGLEANFNLVKDRLGDTCHVRELNVGNYPYQKLMQLLVGVGYDGWVLLECRTKPADRIAALKEQRRVFTEMLEHAVADR